MQVLTKEKVKLASLNKLQVGPYSLVGQSLKRTDARLKVTGKLKYGADYVLKGYLHGKILRSPYPHALIKNISTGKAKQVAGVAAVLVAEDLPGRNSFGAIVADQPVICSSRVRFVGDGVALVAAETEELANRAISLIDVDYEPLPAVFDPREAIKPGAPFIHEKGNLIEHCKLRKGDVEKGFSEADVIIERTYTTPYVEHVYMEPDIIMAVPLANGGMLIEGPMQAPFYVRDNVAAVLGVPINLIRVKSVQMGGGFGGKDDSPIDLGCRAAVLAAHTGRPVYISLEREEVTLQTSKRHPSIMELKIGAMADGRLVSFQGTLYNEEGAYSALGPAGGVNRHSMIMAAGPYDIPNCKVDAYLCHTNHPTGGAMRGFGAPQVCFAHESLIDELALDLGISPFDIRMRNAFKIGSKTATGQILDQSVGLIDTLKACGEAFEWDRRYGEGGALDNKGTRRRGVGIGVGYYRTSTGSKRDGCGANVYVLADGSALLYSGITEMGQGSFTVLPQICAEELGISVDDIRLVQPDTDLVPEAGPTVASRSTTLMGNAIILACRPIRESIMTMAAEMLCVPVERLKAENGVIYELDNPMNSVPFREVTAKCFAEGKRLIGQGWWTPPSPSFDAETGQGNPYFVYSYSTQMAEVAVDMETGEVEVTDYVAAFDIGKAINPNAVEGQIEGGIAMGLGYALMEEVAFKDGYIQNLSLQDLLIPSILDVPNVRALIVETRNRYGPFGAKGVGEMPNIPTAPAILNAITNACGGRIRSLPADPEKVYWAIRKARESTSTIR